MGFGKYGRTAEKPPPPGEVPSAARRRGPSQSRLTPRQLPQRGSQPGLPRFNGSSHTGRTHRCAPTHTNRFRQGIPRGRVWNPPLHPAKPPPWGRLWHRQFLISNFLDIPRPALVYCPCCPKAAVFRSSRVISQTILFSITASRRRRQFSRNGRRLFFQEEIP